jgi:hypothetical protein
MNLQEISLIAFSTFFVSGIIAIMVQNKLSVKDGFIKLIKEMF